MTALEGLSAIADVALGHWHMIHSYIYSHKLKGSQVLTFPPVDVDKNNDMIVRFSYVVVESTYIKIPT